MPAVVTMEFHVARAARARYGFDEAWFQLSGNAVLVDFAATRRLAHRMNQARDLVRHPDQTVNPGQLHAMGLIDEILHYVAKLYREQAKFGALGEALGTSPTRTRATCTEFRATWRTASFRSFAEARHRGTGWPRPRCGQPVSSS